MLREANIAPIVGATPFLMKMPKIHIWSDYDSQADVLYIHFEEKPGSTHNIMREDGIILDYRGDRLVGLTILEASHR